jgi:hypothetical protein
MSAIVASQGPDWVRIGFRPDRDSGRTELAGNRPTELFAEFAEFSPQKCVSCDTYCTIVGVRLTFGLWNNVSPPSVGQIIAALLDRVIKRPLRL